MMPSAHARWSWRGLAAIAVLVFAWPAASQTPADSQFPKGVHLEWIERVSSSESDEYHEVLIEMDRHLRANPDDHVAMVERCRFVTNYAYQEDVTIESASDDSDECMTELSGESYASIPDVRLFLLEQKWGEEAIAEAEQLMAVARQWTPAHRAALHARLSTLYSMNDWEKSGRHALSAVELDPTTGLQLDAAEFLIRIGAKRRAADAIHALPDDQWNSWALQEAVRMFLLAGDPQAAFQLATEKSGIELGRSTRFGLVRALFNAGDRKSGEALLAALDQAPVGADETTYPDFAALRELFELRRDFGTEEEALKAYDDLRDTGWRADPFGWYRLSLVRAVATAPWKSRDLLGPGALILVLVFMALFPAILIVPIHYRSVTKRLHGFVIAESTDLSPWSLRQAWYALASVIVIMAVTLYLFAYVHFESQISPLVSGIPYRSETIDDLALGKSMLWGGMLGLIAFIPLVRRTTLESLVAARWSILRAILGGIGMALGFLFVAGVLRRLMVWSGFAIGAGSETVRSMQGIEQAYGPLAMIGFAVVLKPVMEEFLFRGVLLRASARHLALWAAVSIQAVAFALWHEDPADYPVMLVFGIAAAWLALRSGGLLAPVTFHAAVNLLAATQILFVGRLINQGG